MHIIVFCIFENYKNYTDKAKRQAFKSKKEFSWDKMKEKLNIRITTKHEEEWKNDLKCHRKKMRALKIL